MALKAGTWGPTNSTFWLSTYISYIYTYVCLCVYICNAIYPPKLLDLHLQVGSQTCSFVFQDVEPWLPDISYILPVIRSSSIADSIPII